jgi:predicted DNA-binding transcriptional regulator YafY
MEPVPNQTSPTIQFAPGQVVSFTYRNWKGAVDERTVRVISLEYGSTEWHPEAQWFMRAFDVRKQSVRLFAIRDMIPRR